MNPASAPQPHHRRPWVLSFFGLLAMAGLISMPILAGAPDGAKMPDEIRFIGHFHPLLLHLPIGVLVLVLVQELGATFCRRLRQTGPAPLFPMFFLAASAIIAVMAGFLLYHGGGYEGNATAERHLWGGLVFALLATFTFILRAWTVDPSSNPAVFRLFLFLTAAVMAFASHDGASLTHGSNYLTDYAPDPLRKLLGLPPKIVPTVAASVAPEDRVVYADIVAPILESRCTSCHKEGKFKGGVRLDSHEHILKGSSSGPILVAGDAAKSLMVSLIELPTEDAYRMPPPGKPGMTAEEITIIKWWISQGADPTKTVKELSATGEATPALDQLASATATVAPATAKPTAAPAAADEALQLAITALDKEFPGVVSLESQQSSAVVLNGASLRDTLDDAAFARFAPVLPQLVSADLNAAKLTDQGVASLKAAPRLRVVQLAETEVTDAAIDTLVQLPELESVNLYATKITDAGFAALAALPKLKRIYVWQTAVTPAAIAALKERLPACEIITGL